MGTLLVSSSDTQPALRTPLVPASSAPDVLVDHPIAWDDSAPPHCGYTPCLVKVSRVTSDDLENTELCFGFIHTNTGRLVSANTYTLMTDRTTYGIVHPTAASTLPTPGDLAANRCIGILMLNLDALTDPAMLAEARASAAEGKWPRTAGEIYESAVDVPLLRRVVQTPGVRALLPTDLCAQIDGYLQPRG